MYQMKTPTLFFTALLMTGSLAALVADKTAHAFILRDDLTAGNYCYVSLPANQGESLALEEAFLKKQETDGVIDFYGQCDESPVQQHHVTTGSRIGEQRSEQNSTEP